MTVRRAFLEWLERDFFVQTEYRLPVATARDGERMAVFSRCGHDRSAELFAFAIPLTGGECGDGLSGGLARIALE